MLGFRGKDTQGIPWQTYFDAKTRQPIIGFSGEGNPKGGDGSTRIVLDIDKYKIVSSFED